MNGNRYDVIVVGARCAGSPTAMLLARRGYRVLVVDRATFPSDTISTHLDPSPGRRRARRWGLLDRLAATGCPPIRHLRLRLRAVHARRHPADRPRAPVAYAPRRTRARQDPRRRRRGSRRRGPRGLHRRRAHRRGRGGRRHPRPRHGDGRTVTERARVVVGADGRHSLVAKAVRPEQYHEQAAAAWRRTTRYWSGLPMDGASRPTSAPTAASRPWPTHDDLTLVIAGWPYRRVRTPTGPTSRATTCEMSSWPRPSPSASRAATARGALRRDRGAELLPQALRAGLGAGRRRRLQQGLHHGPGHHRRLPRRRAVRDGLDETFAGRPRLRRRHGRLPATRDTHVLPMYEFTAELATLQPPPPELQQLLGGRPRQPGGDGRLRQRHRR